MATSSLGQTVGPEQLGHLGAAGSQLGGRSSFVVDIIASPNTPTFKNSENLLKAIEVGAARLGLTFGGVTLTSKNLHDQFERLKKPSAEISKIIETTNKHTKDLLGFWGHTAAYSLGNIIPGLVSQFGTLIGKVALFSEHWYYLNRLMRQPGAGSLFSMGFAGSMIGLSSEQTLGAVASTGLAVRTNPGIAAFLSKLLGKDLTHGEAISGGTPLDIVNKLKATGQPDWLNAQY